MTANEFTRRDFFRTGAIAGAALLIPSKWSFGEEEPAKTKVWVFTGTDKTKLMESCLKTISENGGLGKDVKKLALKANAAMARTPDQAATTHPDLVAAFIKGAKAAGITNIVMPEHTSDGANLAWPKNGVQAAAAKEGVNMVDLANNDALYKPVDIPKGVKLKKADVAADFVDADVIVCMPIAKHHGGAMFTCSMKNWMGIVKDRGFWHRNDLHQCIADFSTWIKPKWVIVDATRVLMTNGPKGPGTVKEANQLILSADQVSADAYASTLIYDSIEKIKYLTIARDNKMGETDVKKMDVTKIDVK